MDSELKNIQEELISLERSTVNITTRELIFLNLRLINIIENLQKNINNLTGNQGKSL
jgi:hypothetical protein